MSQDEQRQQQQGAATGSPAATMPDPNFHPFAEEAAQLAQQPQPQAEGQEQGASAPGPQPAPDTEQPSAPQPPEQPEDIRAKYEETQRQLEAERAQRTEHEQLIEQQQRAWMEHQRQAQEAQAAEARKAAETTYNEAAKAAYEKIVSADDDGTGLKELDTFAREFVARKLATEYERRLTEREQEHQAAMDQYRNEAAQLIDQRFRGGFVQEIVQQQGLPEAAAGYLMSLDDPNQIPEKAAELKNLLAQVAPQLQQQAIQQQVQQHRNQGTFAPSGAGGGPLPPEELQPMSAGSPQAVSIARDLLGSITG